MKTNVNYVARENTEKRQKQRLFDENGRIRMPQTVR
jgi:hypothetical protein